MSNPYDEFDAINPWDDEDGDLDEMGGFGPVEDDLDEEGNFDFVDDTLVGAPVDTPATDAFPKTMVRQRPIVDPDAYQGQTAAGGRAERKLRRSRGSSPDPLASRYVGEAPPSVPPYEPDVPRRRQRPKRERRPRRERRHRSHGCLVTLIILAILAVAAYWVVAHPIDERLAFTPQEQQTVNGTLSWSVPATPYYVLALGSDLREGDTYSRSDSMILMRVDLIGGKITMLSIPRDTRVEIEGHGTQKINAAYAFGGAGGAVRAVSKLCNVGIQHVAVIHFEELAGLVDYLGGVTVNVPVAAYDPDHTGADLEAGLQTLDGETALAWARTRYGFERGDFQRQEDQRLLFTAIINRVLSLSPKEMPGALEYIGDLIGTDMRCYNLVPLLLRFKLSNPTIYSCSIPSGTETINGESYVIADEAALRTLMDTINAGGNPEGLLN